MIDPLGSAGMSPIQPIQHAQNLLKKNADTAPANVGSDFAEMLRSQLERVNTIQNEADEGLQKVLTGESENLTEVFVATRKAEVAFSLLMEIRNKMVEAYEELRQLRV
ncbi:MAG: flagellar hook-basal body complex protein FliE [Phycisphaerae bacterium]